MGDLTRKGESLLVYLETRAVDHDGRVDTRKMNKTDMKLAAQWAAEGYIVWWKRLPWAEIERINEVGVVATHHINLGAEAMAIAHRLRGERAERGIKRTAPLFETEGA